MAMQVILALLHSRFNFEKAKRSDFRLNSRTTIVDLLQKFSRIHLEVDTRVNASIALPAKYTQGLLLLSKAHVYSDRALPSLQTLAELVKYKHDWDWDYVQMWHKALLIVQLAALPFAWGQTIGLLGCIVLACAQILLSMYISNRYQRIVTITLDLAWDLLDLKEWEENHVHKLLEHLPAAAYTYPLDLIGDVINFLVGFRHKSKP
jgi:hypothetical protein